MVFFFLKKKKMIIQNDIEITIFPNKFLQKYTEMIIKQIESIEKKTFPKNEIMHIKEEISKKTNTLMIAYYEKDIQKSKLTNGVKEKNINQSNEKNLFFNNYKENNKKNSKEIIVIGYIIYSKLSSIQMPITRILKLCIHQFYRKIGLGEKLLKSGLEKMNVPKRSKADLHVDIEREAAINLYKKVGFKIVRKVVNYYGFGRDAWLMEFNEMNNNKIIKC